MLSDRMRRRVEPEDVAQSVYRSFFRKAEDDRYVLEKSGDLWKLLAAITVSKVRGQVEFHTAKKRGVYTEESLNAAAACTVSVPKPSPTSLVRRTRRLSLKSCKPYLRDSIPSSGKS